MTDTPRRRRTDPVPASLVAASEWSWRIIVVVVAIGLVAYGAAVLGFIVGPVFVALVISALLEPVRRLLLRWGASTTLAWVATFLFGVLVVTSILVAAISEFSSNFDTLSEQALGGVDEFTDWLATGPLKMDAGGLNEAVDNALETLKDDPSGAITGTVSVLSTTSSLLAAGVLTLLTTLFLMKDREIMWLWFTKLSGLLVVAVALGSQGPTTALVMAIVVLVVQQLDANVMYPMLANRHLALHPLASLLLVAAGGVVAGLFGAFVAVPLAAVLIAVGGELRRSQLCNDAPHG